MEKRALADLLKDLPNLQLSGGMPDERAFEAMRMLGRFNDDYVGMVRFSGESPWERYETDELLYIVEGVVRVVIVEADGGQREQELSAGELCIVPKGLWHKQFADPSAAQLFVTGETRHSTADDPRLDPAQP
ncbi:MAG: cupin domain-containing protein [Alphaproteobacteria bacterium]